MNSITIQTPPSPRAPTPTPNEAPTGNQCCTSTASALITGPRTPVTPHSKRIQLREARSLVSPKFPQCPPNFPSNPVTSCHRHALPKPGTQTSRTSHPVCASLLGPWLGPRGSGVRSRHLHPKLNPIRASLRISTLRRLTSVRGRGLDLEPPVSCSADSVWLLPWHVHKQIHTYQTYRS